MHLKLDGLLSICMQHEMDHLDGKVFLDRLSPIKSARLKSKIKSSDIPRRMMRSLLPPKTPPAMTYKILFCGTPEFARAQLETLLDDPRFEVPLVISQPDRPAGSRPQVATERGQDFGAEPRVACLTPEKADDGEFIAELKKHDFDACVVVAYGQILRKTF